MMFITRAYAQTESAPQVPVSPAVAAESPWTMIVYIGIMVVLFYMLLIRPQQKRFKEHAVMLAGLKKGDRVVTGGGLIGTIDTIEGNDEIVVDLGGGMKVTAVRSTIQKHNEVLLKSVSNDSAKKDSKKK